MEVNVAQQYFEDFQIGDKAETPGRTITEGDIVSFACLTGDFNTIHTDAEYAKSSISGQRIAHGLLVWAIATGLNTRTPYHMSLMPSLKVMSSVNLKFKKPVLIGDTIHVVQEIIEKSDERPEATSAKLVCRRDVINQRGEVVQSGIVNLLVAKRPVK